MNEYEVELQELTKRRIELANKYATERSAYGKAKADIDIIFAGKIISMTEKKKNLGYEMGLILLMAQEGEYFRELYKSLVTHLNNYKALERMIDAVESKIMSLQSIMRFYRENDGGN